MLKNFLFSLPIFKLFYPNSRRTVLPTDPSRESSFSSLLLFSRLKATLQKSEGLRFSLLTMASYLLAAVLASATAIAISRLLGPVDFALFSTAASFSYILNQFNSFGLSVAIQKYVGGEWQKSKINKYLSVCLRYRLILSILITSLGIIFAGPIANFFQLDQQLLIIVAILGSLAPTYLDSSQVTLQSLGKLRLAALNYILPAILKFALAMLIYFFRWQSVELILALYLLSTLPSVIIAELNKPEGITYQILQKFPAEEKMVQQILKHSAFAVIAVGLIDNSDLLIAKHYLSNYETGLLAGASRIAMLLTVISGSLANVLFPRVAKYRDRANLLKFLKKAALISLLFLASIVLITPLSPYLIRWSIGADYLPGTELLNILLLAGILNIISVPFIAAFYAFKSNRFFSQSALLQVVIVLLGNLIFIPEFGAMASAYTRLVARLALLVFSWLALYLTWRREFKS